jgi:hypothetical protein
MYYEKWRRKECSEENFDLVSPQSSGISSGMHEPFVGGVGGLIMDRVVGTVYFCKFR